MRSPGWPFRRRSACLSSIRRASTDPRGDFQPSSNFSGAARDQSRDAQQVNLHARMGDRRESPAATRRMRLDPAPPRTASSALAAGFRGTRSSARCSARSRMVVSVQRSKTAPVRSAPLIAVAGIYGPGWRHGERGNEQILAPCARSQNGIALGCSKGIRRPAKFCANPPHEAKSSFSAFFNCARYPSSRGPFASSRKMRR